MVHPMPRILVQPEAYFEHVGIIKINARYMHIKINGLLKKKKIIHLSVKFKALLQTEKEVAGSF